jgi:uncharacterized protein
MLINIREVYSGAVPRLAIAEKIPVSDLWQTGANHINDLSVNGYIENRSGIVRLLITCETDVDECCDRCLTPFLRRYTYDVDSVLTTNEDADDEYLIVDGSHLNLTDVAVDRFLLMHPAKILCKDDCLGLDPETGENLNEGAE